MPGSRRTFPRGPPARHALTLLAAALLLARALGGQAVGRDGYYDHLTAARPLVAQTAASLYFELYGDRGDSAYRDRAPVDGIDDARGQRLLALAERFSPILRRNTPLEPHDVWTALGEGAVLHVDTWRDGVLVRADSIDLRPADAPEPGGGATADGGGSAARGDAKLEALIREYHPRRSRPAYVAPDARADQVLFFDFPGADARTWRAATVRRRSAIYAHPFLVADTAAGEPRFRLALQYWFFYPYNDGPNNHEGDWEHLTVLVTTSERAASARDAGEGSRLTTTDVRRVLGGPDAMPVDSLVIAAVDYYFHHNVMRVDYVSVVARDRGGPPPRDTAAYIWEDVRFVDNAVRARLSYADGRLASHPVGYIGGNSKGPDELLTVLPRFLRSYNRNSGATYPFPATWQTIGPMAATEKVSGKIVPRVRERPDGSSPPDVPWYRLIDDDHYLVHRASDITLLPDWERVQDLVLENAVARRHWSWLVLPVRWGFPATNSPGAGLMKHADAGNLAPMGPTFDTGWNRLGPSILYRSFSPRVLRTPLSPTTPWANVQSGWGFLNYPLAAAGLLPGYNVAVIQLMPWTAGTMSLVGAPPTRTFTAVLPVRFTTEGQGAFVQLGGRDFAQMLPQGEHPVVADVLATRGGTVDPASFRRATSAGPRLWFDLHFGRRFLVENTYSQSTSTLEYMIRDGAGTTAGTVSGRLDFKELTGGFRYSPVVLYGDAIQLYGRAGYGWTWYTLRDVTVDRQPLAGTRVKGGYAPSLLPSHNWWPNMVYAGVGIEYFSPRDRWLLGRIGYGARLETSGILHRLNAVMPGERSGATVRRGDGAFSVIFGW
jgi:hypothetical protein